MGADLHAFIEIDYSSGSGPPFSEDADARAFNTGEFFVRRHIPLFKSLGYEERDWDAPQPHRARGLPPNTSSHIFARYYHPILPSSNVSVRSGPLLPALPPVSEADADEWVKKGWSTLGFQWSWTYTVQGPVRSAQPTKRGVSRPDWHSPGWLSFEELRRVVVTVFTAENNAPVEVRAILQVMQLVETQLGSGRSRFVYWFDN
jgi:hypothetical protein